MEWEAAAVQISQALIMCNIPSPKGTRRGAEEGIRRTNN